MGPQFVYAATVSFALSLPVAHLIRILGRYVVNKAPCAGLSGVEVVLVAGSAWLAVTAGTATAVKALKLPVNCAWSRMAVMAATPLLPCAFFSCRYQQAADSFAAFWSQTLGLLLAVLIGLQTGFQEMTPGSVVPGSESMSESPADSGKT